jgi:signal transduction histidine kinase
MGSLRDRLAFALALVVLVAFGFWSVSSVRMARTAGVEQEAIAKGLQLLFAESEILQTNHPDDPAVLAALVRLEQFGHADRDGAQLADAAATLAATLEVPGARDENRVQLVHAVANMERTLWARNHGLENTLADLWGRLYLIAVSAIAFATGMVGLAGVVRRRDIELTLALEQAEGASHAKSEFLATVSHEIRTPMTAILGTTELLGISELTPDQMEHVQVVREGSQALLRLVDEVLDISRIEAGHLELCDDEVDVEALFDALMLLFGESARAKGLRISCIFEPTVPSKILCDGNRLRQIVVNLLGNAVKFTEEGEVQVCVGYARGHLQVRVNDTGTGVPEEAQKRIFEAFQQAGERRTFGKRGTGLGLAITRRLVQAMGGSVGLESVLGEGSSFRFHVRAPLVAGPEPLPVDVVVVLGIGPERDALMKQLALWGVSEDRDAVVELDLHGMQPLRPGRLRRALAGQNTADLPQVTQELETEPFIAVVDDQPDNREVIGSLLEALGCRVQLLSCGEDVLAASGDWDVILMDVDMPGLDGLATTRALRGKGESAPILGLSGHATEGARKRSLAAGMDDYITKPVGLVRLREALERWG